MKRKQKIRFQPVVEQCEQRALLSAITYSSPLVITKGGTYSGNWQSLSPATPAVTIDTTQPVTITNSNIQSKGDEICSGAGVYGIQLTVTNTNFYGLNPGVAGDSPGYAVSLAEASNVVLEHDYLQSTRGFGIWQHHGSGTITICYNSVLNIDGRISNGNGGWMTGNTLGTDYNIANFVVLYQVYNVAGIDIAWNQGINQPGNSRVEDNININDSSGTAASPILIHDNYIDGAYNINPTLTGTGWGYTGGGILLGDGTATSPSLATGYVQAYNNIVVSTTNYGIAIAAGHNETIYNNTVVSSGLLSNGQGIADPTVAIYIWNYYGTSSKVFHDNSGYGNTVGWIGAGGVRNDWWVPNASSWKNNTSIAGAITLTTEASELTAWQNKLATNKVTLGPQSS